ncbi:N-acetylglucosamine kinase [Tenacibaculum retecalamus]|uniref:N-acetylglucosamine kinase n=1 Tax=Tenacibaculum retecalamus TaxID=3018315 RepID=UPI0023D8E45E|nr:N-acetylglucosamine kinase [Tenacibaculum retecalamus]WBX70713.1 N-acetylglucosamine kinase [Tenacibaculum retecalamus]
MILIADGGSTKTDWIALNKNDKKELFRAKSLGLNPAVLLKNQLLHRIDKTPELIAIKSKVQKIYFYGAGCGSPQSIQILEAVLQIVFPNAKITISEDLLGAVYAATANKPAIVCILGTGSNSCYYNGTSINKIHPSLGYTIMDEASGNYFGKRLLRDFYYQKMPKNLAKIFANQFNLEIDFVKINLYKTPNPNMYLASFAEFMFEYKNDQYIKKLIKKGFRKYFKYQILPYNKESSTPLYFIGSIAYYFSHFLEEVALKNNLIITDIIQRPIDDLVKFHQKNTF